MAFFEYVFEPQDVAVFFTLLLLEGVLSFDNAAVLAALVRKLPVEQRRKALLYGLAGAYVFRTLAILGVAFIIANPFLKAVGGGYLVWLAGRHVFRKHPHDEIAEPPKWMAWTRGFWGVVVSVELADVAFALDQVLVAVALTDKIPLIIVAALIAILFLRIAAAYMTRLMDWFPQLETLAYVAVGWVGLKLISVEAVHYAGYPQFEIPKSVSVSVTLLLLVVPVIGKFLIERYKASRGSA